MILAHLTQLAIHPSTLGLFFQDSSANTFHPHRNVGKHGQPGTRRRYPALHHVDLVARGDLSIALSTSALPVSSRVTLHRVLPAPCAKASWTKPSRLRTVTRSPTWQRLSLPVCRSFATFGSGGTVTEGQIESSQRALERSEAIVHAKLKRGLGGLATIGSTAPFIGLFGTVIGILNAFQKIATEKSAGIGAIAGGISEALVTTAFGLLVAIPAVMCFNYFTNKVEAFDVEMDNSSSELIDYFLKQSQNRR